MMTRNVCILACLAVIFSFAAACGDSGGGNGRDVDAYIPPDAGPVLVEFADPNLESCARQRIGRLQGDITPQEVANVNWLECHDMGIASLEGLQHFTGLTHLSLWENQVFDLTPISGLSNLVELQLGNNGILDLTPISGLTNLKRLGLAVNNIAALGPLASLISLEYLNLDHNRIVDAAILGTFFHLKWVTIEYNDLQDESVLEGMRARGIQTHWTGGFREAGMTFMEAVNLMADRGSVDRAGRIVFNARSNGEVSLAYEANGRTYNVFKVFAGNIILDGNKYYLRSQRGTIAIGEKTDLGDQVCAGAYAQVCQLSIGRKDPTRRAPTTARTAPAAEPVFTAALTLAPSATTVDGHRVEGIQTHDGMPYGLSNKTMIPHVLASPNQFDAGSCLFMANTGAMEILMNQHVPVDQIEYEGDTDLSERYLMNASDRVPGFVIHYAITDVAYTYNHFGGAMLNRDYPFTAGYIRELSNGTIVAAQPSEEGAYFSCYYNWLDDLPTDFRNLLVETPPVERTMIFLDPTLDENSVWDVGLGTDDVIERIKYELRTKKAPVVVVYNHYLYWHSAVIVGYDDNMSSGGCPFVQSTLSYFEDQGARSYVTKIENQMAAEGGCSNQGVFFVRDSIYDGGSDEPTYSYSDQYTFVERYSKRIIEHSYNWPKYLGNHVYSVHRKQAEQ